MTPHDTETHTPSVHETCWEILPWYVNGSLQEEERLRVEQHLATCPYCRQEVTSLQQFQDRLLEYDASAQQQALAFNRLMQRIKQPGAAVPDSGSQPTGKTGINNRLATLWSALRQSNMAYAVTAALLAGVVVGLLIPQQTDQRIYTTLSATQPYQEGRLSVHVIFKPQTPELEIRKLLHHYHATVIAGPGTNGIYTLAIDKRSLSEPQQRALLETLRQHPAITWASALPVANGEHSQ